MATVNIRVIGIYMHEQVDLSLNPDTTVREVMREYERQNPIQNDGGFSLEDDAPRAVDAPKGVLSPTSMSYRLGSKKKTKGHRTVFPGVYTLREPKNVNFLTKRFDSFQAFQYYVTEDLSGGGTRNKSKGGGFTYYNQSPDNYTIEDGDTILWRQVSIKLRADFRIPLGQVPPPLRGLDEQSIRDLLQMRRTNMISEEEYQELLEDLRETGNTQRALNQIEEFINR